MIHHMNFITNSDFDISIQIFAQVLKTNVAFEWSMLDMTSESLVVTLSTNHLNEVITDQILSDAVSVKR